MAAFESAIDYLDRRGLIDRNRVGITGFSRTYWYVTYTVDTFQTPLRGGRHSPMGWTTAISNIWLSRTRSQVWLVNTSSYMEVLRTENNCLNG